MLTTKASDHIRKSKNIRGLHSCRTSTGFPLFHLDADRLAREEAALTTRSIRRAWLKNLWDWHDEWRREVKRV